jgi:rubrerythrin
MIAGRRRIIPLKHIADNILQVAIEMEQIGRTFYESLSAGCGDAEIASLAASLAKIEAEHIETFERMLNSLPSTQRGPKLSEEELLAASDELRKTIIPGARAVQKVVLTSDLFKALDMAIEMEIEAVAFYSGLASVTTGLDKAVMAGIVDEEKEHLRMLQEVRNLLSATKRDH